MSRVHRVHRVLLAAAGLLASVGALTGCSAASAASAGSFGAHGDTAFVGVAVGLQFPERYVNVYKGVQLALDELNASRPSGAPVLAIKRAADNASSPVQVAAGFRDDPSVIGVVGHTESDPTIAAAAIYDDREHDGRHALVAVSPTAAAGEVTRASDWVFRVCPVVSQQAATLAHYLTDSLHRRRIAIVYRNDVSGREFLRTVTKSVAGGQGELLERDPFVEEIAEFGLYAQRLARTRPDGVLIYANTSDVLQVLHAMHAAGLNPDVVSSNGPSAADVTAAGASAHDFDGLRYLALFLPDHSLTPTGTQFVDRFTQRFGAKPDHWAALSYDAAMLIGHAAQAEGKNRRAVRDWIASVGSSRPAYVGATGEIRFDASRNPVDKPSIVTGVAASVLK